MLDGVGVEPRDTMFASLTLGYMEFEGAVFRA
jgi:hypothetical protein